MSEKYNGNHEQAAARLREALRAATTAAQELSGYGYKVEIAVKGCYNTRLQITSGQLDPIISKEISL